MKRRAAPRGQRVQRPLAHGLHQLASHALEDLSIVIVTLGNALTLISVFDASKPATGGTRHIPAEPQQVHSICTLTSGDPAVEATSPAKAPGKRHDFAALYQMWFRQVLCWIRRFGGPDIDAEDLAQEVFLVVHRKLEQFDGVNPAGWLHRIAQLTVRDHRQRAWFRNIFLRSRDVPIDDVVSRAAVQDEQLDDKQRARRFYQLVAQLNPRWQDSFVLFAVVGLTGEEIATLRGIPAGTVRTHVSRARKELAVLVSRLPASGAR